MGNRLNGLPPASRRGIGGSALFHFRAPVPTRRSLRVKQKRSWSWARLAATVALFEGADTGKKRKRRKDLFPQPPRIAVQPAEPPPVTDLRLAAPAAHESEIAESRGTGNRRGTNEHGSYRDAA